MKTYVALLRGINISGQKIIKMADLRAILSAAGLHNVTTYIQSGNVLFQSENTIENSTQCIINAIEQHYGFIVPTIILTAQELQAAASNNPYNDAEGNRLYLTFLAEVPNTKGMPSIEALKKEDEYIQLIDKVLYFHCPNGVARSKITNNLIEKKLESRATTRNWRTTNKLLAMLS